VNGAAREAQVESRLLLVHLLRENLRLTEHAHRLRHHPLRGVHGAARRAAGEVCTVLAVQADGREVETVEGLEHDGKLHPVQEGFWEKQACSAATARRHDDDELRAARAHQGAHEQDIREAISGNLCRCTGYVNIVQAVQYAAAKMRER